MEGGSPNRNGGTFVRFARNKRLVSKPNAGLMSCCEGHLKNVQEKLLRVETMITVLKLTQVGGLRILRRSGEY